MRAPYFFEKSKVVEGVFKKEFQFLFGCGYISFYENIVKKIGNITLNVNNVTFSYDFYGIIFTYIICKYCVLYKNMYFYTYAFVKYAISIFS